MYTLLTYSYYFSNDNKFQDSILVDPLNFYYVGWAKHQNSYQQDGVTPSPNVITS